MEWRFLLGINMAHFSRFGLRDGATAGLAIAAIAVGASEAGATVYDYSGAFQTVVIGQTGTYDVAAGGANGGQGDLGLGGQGSSIGGTFSLPGRHGARNRGRRRGPKQRKLF